VSVFDKWQPLITGSATGALVLNWDAVGAIGEIMGASLVLVTLVYLSQQIRNNTREVKSENAHRVTDSFNQLNLLIASDERLAELWHRGVANYDDLSDTEKSSFGFMQLSAFRIYDSLYYQIQRGTGNKQLWKGEINTIRWLLATPGMRTWWKQQQFHFSPGFQEYIDDIVREKTPESQNPVSGYEVNPNG
jgi:hypothetical protein